MFFGLDLNQIFTFPLKDAEARKHFLTGSLVSLAGFIIPILPFLVMYGYAVRIARQILNNESPRMVEWDDWGGMATDGAKVFGVRLIYTLPILILALPIFVASFVMPIFMQNASGSEAEAFLMIFMVIMFGSMCIFIPLSFAAGLIVPAAEMHSVDKSEFAAGFRVREWWAIFRANLGGFIAAFAVYYVATIALTFIIQILMATLIFACLIPILMPAVTFYTVLIMYATIAQAYKVGKEKLAQAVVSTEIAQ